MELILFFDLSFGWYHYSFSRSERYDQESLEVRNYCKASRNSSRGNPKYFPIQEEWSQGQVKFEILYWIHRARLQIPDRLPEHWPHLSLQRSSHECNPQPSTKKVRAFQASFPSKRSPTGSPSEWQLHDPLVQAQRRSRLLPKWLLPEPQIRPRDPRGRAHQRVRYVWHQGNRADTKPLLQVQKSALLQQRVPEKKLQGT